MVSHFLRGYAENKSALSQITFHRVEDFKLKDQADPPMQTGVP